MHLPFNSAGSGGQAGTGWLSLSLRCPALPWDLRDHVTISLTPPTLHFQLSHAVNEADAFLSVLSVCEDEHTSHTNRYFPSASSVGR